MSLIYIRLATQQDILQMMAIVKDAQHLLASQDIPQWQNGYPNEKVLLNDIEKNKLCFDSQSNNCWYSNSSTRT